MCGRKRHVLSAHAAKKRRGRLRRAGDVKDASDECVKCSNGHRYRHRDFVIKESSVATAYEQHSERVYRDGGGSYLKTWEVPDVYTETSMRVGCPLCKSSEFEFDSPGMRDYTLCRKCNLYYRCMKWDECPWCDPDAFPAIHIPHRPEDFALSPDDVARDASRCVASAEASMSTADRRDFDVLYAAVEKGDALAVGQNLEHCPDVNETAPNSHTLLSIAANEGHTEVAVLLLSRGADASPRIRSGDTPLHIVAYRGHTRIADLLLHHGAEVDARGQGGDTPLLVAAQAGHIGVVAHLVDHGADVEVRTAGKGITPLLLAAFEGHIQVVDLLLKRGADVQARTREGDTPLHFAAVNGHSRIVELLLQHGADVRAKTVSGHTPLQLATQQGRTEIVAVLRKSGGR